jgi:hypothetical protein
MNKDNLGFFSWLQLLFIGLRLTGYIDWSWWWVLSPTIVSIAFWSILIVFYAFVEYKKQK